MYHIGIIPYWSYFIIPTPSSIEYLTQTETRQVLSNYKFCSTRNWETNSVLKITLLTIPNTHINKHTRLKLSGNLATKKSEETRLFLWTKFHMKNFTLFQVSLLHKQSLVLSNNRLELTNWIHLCTFTNNGITWSPLSSDIVAQYRLIK